MDCKLVLDYTGSAATAELPVDWLKYCMEFLPTDIRLKVQAVYALNTNALTQRFLRKLFLVTSGIDISRVLLRVRPLIETQKQRWLRNFMWWHRCRNCSSISATWKALRRAQQVGVHTP
jgi:hypothetical protein